MGKLRLDCPSCGKAVAVSETAKKARCPGCKSVIDVATALSSGLDPATELTAPPAQPEAAQDEGPAPAEAQAGETGETGEGAGEAAAEEGPAGKGPAKEGPADEDEPRKGAPSSRREGESARAAAPPTMMLFGLKSWIVVAVGSFVLFLVLMLLVLEFSVFGLLAAAGIASALGLYLDSALCRITRVNPSTPGSSTAPMVWGLIGFVPFVGLILYALLRAKLVANSPEDIAPPDMEPEEMEDERKVLPPSPASPSVILVLGIAAAGIFVFWRSPAFKVMTLNPRTRRYVEADGLTFNQDDHRMRLEARSSLERYGNLTYVVLRVEGETESSTSLKGPIAAKKTRPSVGDWVLSMDEAGSYRLEIRDDEDDALTSVRFRVRSR